MKKNKVLNELKNGGTQAEISKKRGIATFKTGSNYRFFPLK